ncbi:MAG: hypothetical protein JRI72_00630 [Deltaproteobacteria bacterium]|nr:hypothetical protein [Deltaproteobacteria bacterium]
MKRNKLSIIMIAFAVFALLAIAGCAGMTPLQKHTVAMGTHNRIIGDYLILYSQQTPEIQAKWKAKIDPIVKQLDDAMTVWDNAFTNKDDPEAKRQLYMAVKSQLFDLFFKYGVKVKER